MYLEPMAPDDVRALRSLASIQPACGSAASIAAIESVGPERAAMFLRMLSMVTLVTRRLGDLEGSSADVRECLRIMRPWRERRQRMHAVLGEHLARLDETAKREGIEVFGGKGLGVRVAYPDPSIRDFSDLDVFVRDHADAIKLLRVVRDTWGYVYVAGELPWFKYDDAANRLYGQIALETPNDNPELLDIDIHFGDYSVRHSSRLGLALPRQSPGFHLVPPEENFACVVNNAAGDFFITAKDTNDLLMMLSVPGFDVGCLAARLKEAGLMDFFSFMRDELLASNALTDSQQARLSEFPLAGQVCEPAPQEDKINWGDRCLATVIHAFTAHEWRGRAEAIKIALGAYDYYRAPLKLSVGDEDADGLAEPIRLNPWTCVRLVPLDIAGRLMADSAGPRERPPDTRNGRAERRLVAVDPDIELIDTRTGAYARLADEYFVATVHYDLSPEAIGEAQRAAASRA